MKKLTSINIFILNFIFTQLLFAQTIEADKIVSSIENFYKKIEDFSGDFSQEVIRKFPKRLFHREGKVFFKRPGFMKWDYINPEKIQYIYDGEILWIYQVEDFIVYKQNVKKNELYNSLRFLSTKEVKLKEEFDISIKGKNKNGVVKLKLKPKREENFKTLFLFVEPSSGEIKETLLIDQLNNESHIIFKNISYKEVDKNLFKFEPPKGVKVQDLGGQK